MVRVSSSLVKEKVKGWPKLEEALGMLEDDDEVQDMLFLCNEMVVSRLYYNDHGPTHARIVAGSALEIADVLNGAGVKFSTVGRDDLTEEDARLITMIGAYLHDIGNLVHRVDHHITGVYLADRLLREMLPKIYGRGRVERRVRQEVLHCVLSHDESVQSLTVESGIVKVADGTDMSGGRARVPYRHGKSDIHALSALAITSVELSRGSQRPLQIDVNMVNEAGVFQVEEVLAKKIATSGIEDLISVRLLKSGQPFKVVTDFRRRSV
ncbi:MAG: HD domain-containing protein [Thaumarchaeota archaeon]|nr:HD domain-containing protein [Candidatus Calditenuaceae archaeon]MDW8042031.1 HD domain-containing protein [Nitrososphaerota archaeon]